MGDLNLAQETPLTLTDLSKPLVCPALSSLGFVPILQITHPLLKFNHHCTTICTGVPQDSVLGPLLLVPFISLVTKVMNPDLSETSNLVSFHQYADDTQLYIGTNQGY